MTIQIPRNDTVKVYEDWLVIAVKTEPRLATYSFIAISPQDQLYHIDEGEYQSVADAILIGKKFVDLEEAKFSAKGVK